MSYVVLARKYRPADLQALVGQEHIARALRNAIAMDRVAHAFLFCGARGTGKTSTARILAKMLNCKEGPTAEPCGVCPACTEIASSTSIDVHELDAASNRGIGEIRELREGVGYAPARDRHKIYIIDEAHMLTTEAANAFLKTLEEPPPHVVFVLATTDPQRLPVTIRSRCQRYDFRRIRSSEVVQQLATICASEGVTIEQEALYLIAREGDGSMRDSLSVLDQVIAFGGAEMAASEVAALLGVADRNRTAQLIRALLERDAPAALSAVGAAHTHGMDLRVFGRTLAMEARDLLMVRLMGSAARDLVDRSETEVQALSDLVAQVQTNELERLAHVLLELAETIARSRHPRLVMEMSVVRLCRAPALRDVSELAGRVEALLHQAPQLAARGGGDRPQPNRGAGGGQRAQPRAAPTRGAQPTPRAAARGDVQPASATPPSATPPPQGASRLRQRPRVNRPPAAAKPAGSADDDRPAPGPVSVPAPRPLPARRAPLRGSSRPAIAGEPTTRPRADTAPMSAAPAPAADGARRGRSLRDADLAAWHQALLSDLSDQRAAGVLEHAIVANSGVGRVALAFSNRFMTSQARHDDLPARLIAGAARAFGGSYVLEIAAEDERAATESLAAKARADAERLKADHEAALTHDPDVRRVITLFGGKLVGTVAEQELLSSGAEERA